MWSYSIEFLDDTGHVIGFTVLSAWNQKHAELQATQGHAPADYHHLEVTRL